jgi:hypothetical protein
MKNLKLMFTALTVIAIVGGSLAFKATKFTTFRIYQKNAQGLCPILAGEYNPDVMGTTFTNAFSTSITTGTTVAVSLCTHTITADKE